VGFPEGARVLRELDGKDQPNITDIQRLFMEKDVVPDV
jgi:hypothetical protein